MNAMGEQDVLEYEMVCLFQQTFVCKAINMRNNYFVWMSCWVLTGYWYFPLSVGCRHACRISERYDYHNIQSRCYETSGYLGGNTSYERTFPGYILYAGTYRCNDDKDLTVKLAAPGQSKAMRENCHKSCQEFVSNTKLRRISGSRMTGTIYVDSYVYFLQTIYQVMRLNRVSYDDKRRIRYNAAAKDHPANLARNWQLLRRNDVST